MRAWGVARRYSEPAAGDPEAYRRGGWGGRVESFSGSSGGQRTEVFTGRSRDRREINSSRGDQEVTEESVFYREIRRSRRRNRFSTGLTERSFFTASHESTDEFLTERLGCEFGMIRQSQGVI
jgi:hypothetical protein